jgi:hypothetical protein
MNKVQDKAALVQDQAGFLLRVMIIGKKGVDSSNLMNQSIRIR